MLAVIAEVEDLRRTLRRFPGTSREDLLAILLGGTAPDAPVAPPPPDPGLRTSGSPASGAAPAEDASELPAAPELPLRPPPPPPAAPRFADLVAYTDGASRGNPGPASIGVVLQDTAGRRVDTIARTIGKTTNNVAEYEAVRAALQLARQLGAERLLLRADSELAVRQLTGVYKVRNEQLRPIFEAVKALERTFPGGVRYQHVPRESNREADALANEALDEDL